LGRDLLAPRGGGGARGGGPPTWVFRAINYNDGAYVALARRQTALELGTTKGPTRSLRLDCSLSRRSRWDARIIAGAKSIVTNTLSSCITKTGRERRLLAGRYETSVDASQQPRPYSCYSVLGCARYWVQLTGRTRTALALIYASSLDGGAILRHGRCCGEKHCPNRRQKNGAHGLCPLRSSITEPRRFAVRESPSFLYSYQ